ncbi:MULTISPECIES: hypothetical protein [unclassified Streptomyces]|uniref:hypothetical protein n=1 Tax=unclassified Streptomyces TaxID=2593676 RepID=UPI002DD8A27E|nr:MULTISPECIES: hypothetical protein [unclassified Streptomyces]WSA92946.1 hypothetical protein OIE63_16235 [Streptomyces sp. NBC_01795]WSS14420.1 hypothetical protein OG533_22900 [Streptomyces sp. NBC_01186]WSS43237.1 hypothetical protein OG220_23580 [Streptomyces sp. NBC_01187]
MSFGQGGPEWGSGSTPDWAALAEQAERHRSRRRRWLMAGGGALATAAVAGIVALAVVNEGGGDGASDKPSSSLPAPEDLPSSSDAQPTFKDEPPPPPPPRDFIADAEHDKAPLSAATLFPAKRITVNGHSYKLASTSTSKNCAQAAHAGLGPVLTGNDCDTLYRATFTSNGLAVTVGIAAFEDAKTAAKVKKQYRPNLVALPGNGVPDFCRTVTCRTTANSLGRYAYFTIAGRTNGKESGPSDTLAQRVALDGSNYAYARVLQRGRAQSSEAAKEPAS